MGFNRPECIIALRECDNDISRAAENLLSYSVSLTNKTVVLLLISRLLLRHFSLLNLFSLHSSELGRKDDEETIHQKVGKQQTRRDRSQLCTEEYLSGAWQASYSSF